MCWGWEFTQRLSSHGFCGESACAPMASEAIIQLRTHTERLVCHDVVHPSAGLLPGCRQYCGEAGRISADVGSSGRCHLHSSDWIWVRSDQWLLWLAKEKELALTRFIRPPGTVVPDGLMFYCCFLFVFSGTLYLWAPFADRCETLTHDWKCVHLDNVGPKIGPPKRLLFYI